MLNIAIIQGVGHIRVHGKRRDRKWQMVGGVKTKHWYQQQRWLGMGQAYQLGVHIRVVAAGKE